MVRCCWIAVLGVTAAACLPDVARACSSSPQLTSTVPAGSEHPSNAAVILRGNVPLDLVTATIDGMPVTVLLDDTLSADASIEAGPNYWMVLAVRFEPEPMPGQTVIVDGAACDYPDDCPPYHVEYVATEPDLGIAGDMLAVSFDLVRYTSTFLTSCGNYGSVIRTSIVVPPDAWADEAYVGFEVRAFHEELGIEDVRHHAADWEFPAVHYLDTEVVGDAFPLDGWCVEVTPRDAAGNEGVVVWSCDACMYAEAEGGTEVHRLEPIPGGVCDLGGSTSSSTGGPADTSGGEDSTTEPTPDPTDDLPSDDDPPLDDGDEPPDDGDTTGAPAQDDGVTDRGCACSSSASPSAIALLLIGFARRRRTSPRAQHAEQHQR